MAHVGQGHGRGFTVLIGIGLIFQQVYVALDLMILHIGHHQRADHRAELGFQLLKNLIKVGVLVVHLIDEEHGGDALFLSRAESLLRADSHAAFARYHHHGAARRADAFPHAPRKVEETGVVQQVYLGILPFHRQQGGGHRRLPLDFLRIKIANGIPIGDTPQTLRLAGQIKSRFGQRGLSRTGMADQGNISDGFGVVLFQV